GPLAACCCRGIASSCSGLLLVHRALPTPLVSNGVSAERLVDDMGTREAPAGRRGPHPARTPSDDVAVVAIVELLLAAPRVLEPLVVPVVLAAVEVPQPLRRPCGGALLPGRQLQALSYLRVRRKFLVDPTRCGGLRLGDQVARQPKILQERFHVFSVFQRVPPDGLRQLLSRLVDPSHSCDSSRVLPGAPSPRDGVGFLLTLGNAARGSLLCGSVGVHRATGGGRLDRRRGQRRGVRRRLLALLVLALAEQVGDASKAPLRALRSAGVPAGAGPSGEAGEQAAAGLPAGLAAGLAAAVAAGVGAGLRVTALPGPAGDQPAAELAAGVAARLAAGLAAGLAASLSTGLRARLRATALPGEAGEQAVARLPARLA